MMKFLSKHWYDLAGILAVVVLIYLFQAKGLTTYDYVLWLSLVSLFVHQLEEYRIVGTFPGMVNRAMYNSDLPDRYPLNAKTSVYVNVFVGWLFYFLAALLGAKAVWLGIATILISLGNTVAHTTVFNIKGKTMYNAGLATSWLLFVPCIYFFFKTIHTDHLVTLTDYLIGIPLGIVLNVVGILKLIDWFADKQTTYIFEQRNLLRRDRRS
nr:HXXEE domain-containing protein [uncultured Arsenicibacter sp.]